ncbi:1,6-anhydro-N-acetylmuramyl-L-alanine amidase AmpD [Candidatus Methylospira mobilis]|uniref:1,6-anhydro-N-acetylmuramyl-L-alanine amidase AmpD n=1 Tax=Candidatus Methylospira mobilis TaxID=1808979 RepID=UPI0028E75D49|nr:1,6-anhydro-N-acetylmuramyl-L-alanine amidase AmpD [Candidatus Methylospira mobilis]WNV03695.1 1,6-anhydro-N-acetylmuramyl-L-alanine amidase AmpD [Candidatus Methylospira mobilis]
MKIIKNGLLEHALQAESPNSNVRPDETDISLIVIHCISLPPGEFGGPWIDRLFNNTLPGDAHPYFHGIQSLRVSAHLLIRRDGSITQYVPFHKRAWHAGISCYKGRENCNDFSIGIELEGTETADYDPAQYDSLVTAIGALADTYPGICADRIVGHSEIAPARKTDPGPSFDWAFFRQQLARGKHGAI